MACIYETRTRFVMEKLTLHINTMTPVEGVIFYYKIFQKPLAKTRTMFYNMTVRLRNELKRG